MDQTWWSTPNKNFCSSTQKPRAHSTNKLMTLKKVLLFQEDPDFFGSKFAEISCTTPWHAHSFWWLHDQNVTSCILVLTTEQTGRREENQLRGENTWLSSYFIITRRPSGSARSVSVMKLDSLKLRGLSRVRLKRSRLSSTTHKNWFSSTLDVSRGLQLKRLQRTEVISFFYLIKVRLTDNKLGIYLKYT